MNPQTLKKAKSYILYDADSIGNAEDLSFDSRVLAQRGAILGAAEGRGTAFFIQLNGMDIAMRHYHRGGLASRLVSDGYLWTGLRQTRAWREWYMLQDMHSKGLPVPQPVAAQVVHDGLIYTADIMTIRIPQSQPLSQQLLQHALLQETWQAVGRCIRRFHDAGVYHADLNANNILLNSDNEVFVIDFDRGRYRQPAKSWQQQNLDRLKRSLDKYKGKAEHFYFSESDWQTLLDAYQAGPVSE